VSRLPQPGGDDDTWGDILNDFLEVAHNADGSLQTNAIKAANGVTSVNGKTPTNGAVTLAAGDVGAAQVLSPVTVVTSAGSPYSATAGAFIPIDASGGNVIVNLPHQPADATRIEVKLIALNSPATNTVTINSVSGDVFNKTSGSTSVTLSLLNQAVMLQYASSTGIWYVQSDDLPLSQLDSRYLNFFNVKAYGAVGNGTTVDTAAVQATVNAALAAGGGTVYFPPGTYVMSNVTFGSNLVIMGAGQGNTTTVQDFSGNPIAGTAGGTVLLMDPAAVVANGSNVVVCRVAPASSSVITRNCLVRDLTIDGNKSQWGSGNASTQRSYGYYLGQSTNNLIIDCAMENVTIQNCRTYAFDVERVVNIRLTNCSARYNGYVSGSASNCDGFTLIGDDITVTSCQSYGNAVYGFRGGQSGSVWHRVEVVGCEAWGNGQAGIGMGSDASDALYESHVIGGRYYSNGASSNAAGIYLSTNCTNCSVIGASSYNNSTNGILASGVKYCTISGNTTYNNATASSGNPEIYLTNTTTYTTVTGNTVNSTTATHAISEQNATTDYNVISNNVVSSTSTAIVVNGTHTYVSTNQGYTGGDIGPAKTFTGKVTAPSLQITTSPTAGYVLTSDALGNATWQMAGAPLASAVDQTANFTAAAGSYYPVNATSAAVTVTLPTSAVGQVLAVKKTDVSTNTVTLSGTINGTGSSTLVLSLKDQSKVMLADASGGWNVYAGDTSLTQLDARYNQTSVYDPAGIAQQVLGTTATQTFTNKRYTRRLMTVTQSATPTINTDATDIASITGLAQNVTSMSSGLTGTPVDGDSLVVRITDNGTPRTLTWGASFEASTVAPPTTTVASTMVMVGFTYNAATSKWRCVAVA
jgi:hypothetical protein